MFFVFYSLCQFANADEAASLELILEESPELLLKLISVTNPETESVVKSFQRTDLIKKPSFYDMTFKDGVVSVKNTKVEFETPENSLKNIPNEKERMKKYSTQIYKWAIDVAVEGDFIFIVLYLLILTEFLMESILLVM